MAACAGLCLLAAACSRPGAPGADTSDAAPPRPALWKLSDADNSVWIFGTAHLLRPGTVWRSAAVEDAFAASEILVLETDIDPEGQAALQREAAAHALLPQGARLQDRLDGETWARLTRVAQAQNIDPESLQPLRPWMAALQLTLRALTLQGHAEDYGVETTLAAEAEARGLEVRGLETAERHMLVLSGLSARDEAAFLAQSLREIEEAPEITDALDTAWVSGDLVGLEQATLPSFKAAGDGIYQALIAQRNAEWAEPVAGLLEGDRDAFVAVGAAHLVGSDSLIALLRARGLAVEGP